MTLDQLLMFRTAARRLNFTAVGLEMNVTQSAVSLGIKALERELEVKLFERHGPRISLTPAGEELLGGLEGFLQALSRVKGLKDESAGTIKGRLLLGSSVGLGTYMLPELTNQFKQQYPQVMCTLIIESTEHILGRLMERELHLALTEGLPPRQWRSQLQVQPFGQEELVLIASPDFSLPDRPLGRWDIAKLPLFLREAGSSTRQALLERLAACGLAPEDLNVRMELGHTEAIKRLVAAGQGLAFVAHLALASELKAGVLRLVEVDPELQIQRPLYLVQRLDGPASRVGRAFEDFLWQSAYATVPRGAGGTAVGAVLELSRPGAIAPENLA